MIGVYTYFKVTTQLTDHRLMVSEQICQHCLGWGILPWVFLQAGLFEKFCERACRIPAERTRTFRHIVDNRVDLVVLILEELMEVVKLRSHHIPMVVARLGI
jgi:hypothetical protein